ncbi:MAG: ADOP family duplicated permease [Acidobacteriota bacterium]
MRLLLDDLLHALRRARRRPTFAIGVILTVGLGIGASVAMVSVVDAVLFRELPYERAEQLMILRSASPEHGAEPVSPSVSDYLDWRARARSFSGLAAFVTLPYNLPLGDRAFPLEVNFASADFFNVLGAEPALGRVFSHVEEEPGDDLHTVILSHHLWMNRFEGDPSVLGRTILLDTTPYVVTGVMPPDFTFGLRFARNADAWAPLESWFARFGETMRSTDRGNRAYYNVVARLEPGVDAAAAERELDGIARALAVEHPGTNKDVGATVTPLREMEVGGLQGFVLPLVGATWLVLLLACANAANLVLARAVAVEQDTAVRTALGAGRWSLTRALIVECGTLAFGGCVLGTALGAAAVGAMRAAVPVELPSWMSFAVGPRTLALAVVAGAVVAVGVSVAPVLYGLRIDIVSSLRSGGRGGMSTVGARRVRSGLVVAQVALAVVLLVGAGLLAKSVLALSKVDSGLDPELLIAAHVSPPGDKYRGSERFPPYAELYTKVLERLRALPGVAAAGGSNVIPNDGEMDFSLGSVLEREGDTPEMLRNAAPIRVIRTSANYFDVAGIPIVAGRGLRETDRLGSLRVAVVGQATARRLWPGESPIGKRFRRPTPEGSAKWITVVGVAGDVHYAGLDRTPPLAAYVSYNQIVAGSFNFVVRARGGDPAALTEAVQRAVWEVDPQVGVYSVRTMERVLAGSYWQHRLWGGVLAVFAALALALAAVGIYGVMAQVVGERRREIGLRIALGARPGAVLAWVERRVILLAATGALVGVLASLGLARSLHALLFDVAPTDLSTLVAVPVVVVLTAAAAALPSALRAARVDPSATMQGGG